MPHPPRAFFVLGLLALAACGEDDASFSGEGFVQDSATGAVRAEEPDRFAVFTRGGEVKLGLTAEHVYLRLSDSTLTTTAREMEEDTRDAREEGGFGAAIAERVTRGVSEMLRHRMQWPAAEVRDVRYEGNELVLEMEDGSRETPVDFDDPGEGFDPAEMEAFTREFRALKSGAPAAPR